VELRGLEPLAFWMQTTGVSLLAVSRCSPQHVRTPTYDSRSAHGLLYLAAVRNDSHHLIRRKVSIDQDRWIGLFTGPPNGCRVRCVWGRPHL
jgi:hypothetical protein